MYEIKNDEDLKPEMHGMKVTCTLIYNTPIVVKDGKLFYREDNESYYICQNVCSGNDCGDKFGYVYSYQISSAIDRSNYYITRFCDDLKVYPQNNNYKYRENLVKGRV